MAAMATKALVGLTYSKLAVAWSGRASMSMFGTKRRRAQMKKNLIKYEKRVHSLDPEHDKDLPVYTYAATNRNPISCVYTWGLACYGALGIVSLVRPELRKTQKKPNAPRMSVHHPIRCAAVELLKVTDVACGYGFTVFAINDQKGHIYGTGINKDGQIGYHAETPDHPCQVLITPVPVKLPLEDSSAKVKRVDCGRSHTLALTNMGEVYSLGNNSFGQCGRPIIDNEDYFRSQVVHRVQVPVNAEDRVVDVKCGMDHSLLVTEMGHVFSCGWSADGQTGLGHYNNQALPERVRGDIEGEKIVTVTCAADCVLALNDKGDVFGWGNSEYCQFNMVTDEQQLNTPIKLNLAGVGKVIDVASGGSMCMVLNDQHDVFVWGYGILGKGPNVQQSSEPILIPSTLFGRNEFDTDVVTTSVTCGISSNGAINSNGDLFMWGKNRARCLGLGDDKDQFFPLKVNLGGSVRRASLGVDHTVALCKRWT